MVINHLLLADIVRRALEEDMGTGDITTSLIVHEDVRASARIVAKESGVLAGLPIISEIYRQIDAAVQIHFQVHDGDAVSAGTTLAELTGPAGSILIGERVSLNFIQRLSGIATATRRVVEQLAGTSTRLLDTRKTTPGLRMLEKYAVAAGGGVNHRFGLYDAILIKDNHIAVAGGITAAVRAARLGAPMTMKIEVETEDLAGVQEALDACADIIMLDNMDPDTMRQAVKMVAGRAITEASGRVGIDNSIQAVAATGVDYISMGSLTYASRALDISLDIETGPADI